MRAQLIGAVLAAALACGAAHAQVPPKAKESVAEKELREKSGSMAEKMVKGEIDDVPGDKMVEDFLADLEPINVQLERAMREAERREILQGKSGPFQQIKVAWEEREWPPLLYGVGQIVLWGVGIIFVIWLISAIVRKLRGER